MQGLFYRSKINYVDNTRVIQSSIQAANIADLKAITDSAVSVTKNVTDGTVSVNKSISDLASANALAGAEMRLATSVASGETRLASEISDNVTRGAISDGFKDSALAAKDIQIAIYKDGCETRNQASANFAAIQKELCDAKLEALRCCCEMKEQAAETRALVLSTNNTNLQTALADAKTELLFRKCKE